MRFLLMFPFFLILFSTLFAQNEVVKFKTITHDFGILKQGEAANHLFVFQNISNKPIPIVSIKSVCNCMTVEYDLGFIAPGDSGKFLVSYDSYQIGKFQETVEFIYDFETTIKPIILTLKGEIKKKYEGGKSNLKYPQPLNIDSIYKALYYSPVVIQAGIEGMVVVKILIGESGFYVKHRVLKMAHPLLLKEVEKVIPKVRFTPPTFNGKKIAYWVVIPFEFKLSSIKNKK